MNTHPASEKPLLLISLCLGRACYTISVEVSEYFNCSKRQAIRIMKMVNDMQFECGWYWSDFKRGNISNANDERCALIKIQLDRKYL